MVKSNNIFEAKVIGFPNLNYKAVGELYEDMYIIPVKHSNGEIKNHFVQSNKFYIREYGFNSDMNKIIFTDYRIDPETLGIIDDEGEVTFVGIDLARDLDIACVNGEYFQCK